MPIQDITAGTVFEAMKEPVLILDTKGIIVHTNSSFERVFCLVPSDVIGKHLLELAPLAENLSNIKVTKKRFNQVLKMDPIPNQEYTMKNKNGEQIWLTSDINRLHGRDGKPDYIITMLIDITASKRVQSELQHAQEELRLVLDSVPAGLWYKDTKNNCIRVNAAAAATVHMKPEDIEGKSAFDLFPEHGEKYFKDDLEVLQSGKSKIGIIEPLYSPSGNKLWVETDKIPIFDEAGNVTGLLAIATDITFRIKAEQELKETHEKLIFNERLATLGKITGGVGHELRNPLASIKNASYFLTMALESPDQDIKETLDILSKEIANCERIITSLLDYARPKPPTIQKVSIPETISTVLSSLRIPSSIKVDVRLDDNLVFLLGDRHQLERVFINLITNAIQAMPKGGQLSIFAHKTEKSTIQIAITDTGVGISEENMKHLFEPLYTTRSSGIGLGLVIVKSLVDAHEGTIEVTSKVKKGSQFIVTLPLPDGGSIGG